MERKESKAELKKATSHHLILLTEKYLSLFLALVFTFSGSQTCIICTLSKTTSIT